MSDAIADVASAVGGAVNPISAIANTIGTIVGRIWPDKTQEERDQLQAQLTLQMAQMGLLQAQIGVDNTEAASKSVFVAGWRPFVGWVCGVSLASQFVIGPFFTWGAALFGSHAAYPSLDLGTLMDLLVGLLGMAGMRTFEKVKGIDAGH